MVVIDTDLLSDIIDDSVIGLAATKWIQASGMPSSITVVTLLEILKGRIDYCSKARTAEEFARGAEKLVKTFDGLRTRVVLPFDGQSILEFKRLKALKLRIGSNDLRIAAIVLAHRAQLWTRNLRDFKPIPGLDVAEMSSPETSPHGR